MSFRAVRQSKYRHVFGKEFKKDKCYDGIKISRNAWDSTFSDCNRKFLAVVLEAQGGGAFMVLPLEKTGRVGLNHPRVCGHKSAVLDLQFNPHNDNLIASCAEDCLVMVWELPDGGLTSDLRDPVVTLEGHQRRVGIVRWHPTAENVLLSAGFDYMIFIWNCETQEPINQFDMHTDTIYGVDWNPIGSHFVTTSKDKMMRYIDARTGTVVSEGKCHDGSKASRAVFCGETGLVFSTGFSRMSERQYALWNPADLSKPYTLEMIDTGSGVLFPQYDEDINVVFVAGKGDGNIRYYEVEKTESGGKCYFLSDYKSSAPQRGIAWMPKLALNVNNCEIARAMKLHPKGLVEPISFTVPRKSTLFQEDIYPPTRVHEPSMSIADWVGGANNPPKKVDMKEFFVPESRTSGAAATKGLAPKKGGLSSGLKSSKPAAAAKPAPAAAAASSGGGSSGEVAELKAVIAAKDAEIKELKKFIATLEIKLREVEGSS